MPPPILTQTNSTPYTNSNKYLPLYTQITLYTNSNKYLPLG